ncbi:MAG TPA: dihydrofolate reductase family protein [Solirubrobacteraceae bacterium]|nr:dihydrofolate reductase family protein [Solirubrobacteraceae bacterium]
MIVQVSLSLDGFVSPARGAGDHRGSEDAVLKQAKLDWLEGAGTHIMGRVTYEEMARHWPTSTDAYAPPMNDLPKVVFSKTLETAAWKHSRVARGELATEIAALKEESGGHIVAWGGAAFLQALSRAGLVDEYRLVFNPVALGDGLPLFKDLSSPLRLALVTATTYEDGAALHVYRPAVTT